MADRYLMNSLLVVLRTIVTLINIISDFYRRVSKAQGIDRRWGN